MFFRPEEKHVRSCEPDILIPARHGNAKMHDSTGWRHDLTTKDFKNDALATVRTSRGQRSIGIKECKDPECIPDTDRVPSAFLHGDLEWGRCRAEGVHQPDVEVVPLAVELPRRSIDLTTQP